MKKNGAPPDPHDTVSRLHAEDMARINADPQKVAALKRLKEFKDKEPVYPLPISVLQEAEERARKEQRSADRDVPELRVTKQMHLKPALYAPGVKEVRNARRTAPMLDDELEEARQAGRAEEARRAAIEADKARPDIEVQLPAGNRHAPTELQLVKQPVVLREKPAVDVDAMPVTASPPADSARAKLEDGIVPASRAEEKTPRSVVVPIVLALGVLIAGALLWWKMRGGNDVAAATGGAPAVTSTAQATQAMPAAAPDSAPRTSAIPAAESTSSSGAQATASISAPASPRTADPPVRSAVPRVSAEPPTLIKTSEPAPPAHPPSPALPSTSPSAAQQTSGGLYFPTPKP